ncbi:MAG TPA: hypothetical protein VEX18_10395 [Polyangiaceae bacterium]|nr:hypothetical protein [Polyangiaceae bacterium]
MTKWTMQDCRRYGSTAAVLLSAMSGCTSATAEDPALVPGGIEIEPRVRADWAGAAVGADPGRWRLIELMQFGDEEDAVAAVHMDPSLPNVPGVGEGGFVIAYPELGEVVRVELDGGDQARIVAHLESLGYGEGRPGDDLDVISETETLSDDETLVGKSFSGGVDGRVPKGIAESGMGFKNFNRTGRFGGCTAALVGTPDDSGDFVLTAAHCLFDGSGNWLQPTFTPRSDSCKRANGTTVPNCDTTPFGVWTSGQYKIPAYYNDNCRVVVGGVYSANCQAEDIAIVKVTKPAGETHPGSFGWGAYKKADLAPFFIFNRGYAGCSSPGAPVSCRSNTLYGDASSCALGALSWPAGGWDLVMSHGCDTNPGHSGSPMYIEPTGVEGISKIFGVNTSDNGCYANVNKDGDTCTPGATPSFMRRISPNWDNTMKVFMGL